VISSADKVMPAVPAAAPPEDTIDALMMRAATGHCR
jgi:hypothetical protein